VSVASKNSILVPGPSTSTKTTPKALVVAAMPVPGTKNVTSVILLFDGRKQPLRAESLQVARETEQRRGGQASVGAHQETGPRRAENRSPRRIDVEEIGWQEAGIGPRVRHAIPVDLAANAAEGAVGPGDDCHRRRPRGRHRAWGDCGRIGTSRLEGRI
jgi:hypothetical protein